MNLWKICIIYVGKTEAEWMTSSPSQTIIMRLLQPFVMRKLTIREILIVNLIHGLINIVCYQKFFKVNVYKAI